MLTSSGQILAEAEAHDRRVIAEHAADFRRRLYDAQRTLDAESRKCVDENGVTFAVGQTVTNLCELWYTKPNNGALAVMVVGYTGVITAVDSRRISVQFQGREGLHYIGRDRARLTLRVVQ